MSGGPMNGGRARRRTLPRRGHLTSRSPASSRWPTVSVPDRPAYGQNACSAPTPPNPVTDDAHTGNSAALLGDATATKGDSTIVQTLGEPGDAHRSRELLEQWAPRHADVPLSSGPEVQPRLLWRLTR